MSEVKRILGWDGTKRKYNYLRRRTEMIRIHQMEIDPMALILRGDIYVKIHLPRPVPTEVLAEIAKGMNVTERKEALVRAKEVAEFANACVKELSR
jgi:hypothetical protein